MQINEIHDFIEFVLDKVAGGSNTHAEIDMALDRASQATFRQFVPYYAENQTYQDALAPFKTIFTFTNATSENGIVQLPANYQRLNSLWMMVYNNNTQETELKEVSFVNDDDWAERRRSQLDPIAANPIARWMDVTKGRQRFQIAPEKPAIGQVVYLKIPNTPKYEYTQVGRVITYNAARSVQLEWSEGELNNVMYRALQYLGVNLSQEMMVQYTQLKLADA